MVDVLAEIGTSSAEAALAELLKTTARGFEIAYTARALRARARATPPARMPSPPHTNC